MVLPTIQKRDYGKNGSVYSQYRINVSQKLMDSLGWNGNDELELLINNGKLVCKNLSIKKRG